MAWPRLRDADSKSGGNATKGDPAGHPSSREKGEGRTAERDRPRSSELVRVLRAFAEGDLEGLYRTVTVDRQGHLVARRLREEEIEQRVATADGLIVEGGDHVADLDASVVSGTVVDNVRHHLAFRGQLPLDAEVRPDDLSILEQIGGRLADGVALHRERHVGRTGTDAHRTGADAGGIDADHFAAQVE